MGCDISYSGCIPDESTQEKMVNFMLTKMTPDKVIQPRPEILVNRINEYHDVHRIMKNIGWEYDEEIIKHEPVVPDHPFNFLWGRV